MRPLACFLWLKFFISMFSNDTMIILSLISSRVINFILVSYLPYNLWWFLSPDYHIYIITYFKEKLFFKILFRLPSSFNSGHKNRVLPQPKWCYWSLIMYLTINMMIVTSPFSNNEELILYLHTYYNIEFPRFYAMQTTVLQDCFGHYLYLCDSTSCFCLRYIRMVRGLKIYTLLLLSSYFRL
jgi:hypothetical protein